MMKRHSQIWWTRAIINVELLCFLLVIICALVGVFHGVNLGSSHGMLGRIIGGIGGFLVGVFAAVAAIFIVALINEPFERFWRWWRPYPPVCENGTCNGFRGYNLAEIPEDLLRRVKGLSHLGWRCKCGNIYAGGYGYGMQNR